MRGSPLHGQNWKKRKARKALRKAGREEAMSKEGDEPRRRWDAEKTLNLELRFTIADCRLLIADC
jgi:hypothetical protein